MSQQLSLVELSKTKKPQPAGVQLKTGKFKLIHIPCGTIVGYVTSLGYHIRDKRAGFTSVDGTEPDHRRRIYCPWNHCGVVLTNISDLQAIRVDMETSGTS